MQKWDTGEEEEDYNLPDIEEIEVRTTRKSLKGGRFSQALSFVFNVKTVKAFTLENIVKEQ